MEIPWRIYGASAIGKGHIDGALPCQDAFMTAYGCERLIAVVCDGAGSASNSAIGAKACAEVICSFLTASPCDPTAACDRSIIEQAVEAARAQIDLHAQKLTLPARELSCTLVGAILFSQGGCLFHIGDGMAVVDLAE